MRRDVWRTAAVPALVLVFLLGLAGVSAADPQTYTATGGMAGGSLTTRFDTSGTFDGTYLFDVELWNGGTRVYQDHETRILHGSSSESLTRALPSGLNGTYTLKAGVFSADWSTKYLFSENAGTVGATPLTFTASPSGSGGQFQTVFTASQRTTASLMFDMELWSGGNRVYQYYEPGTLTDGGTYTLTRTLPVALAKGSYTARVGVFSADWSTRYLWNENAGTVAVAGPPPVPTFTASSSIAGSSFRTAFTASGTSTQDFLFDVELWDGGTRVYQSTETMPVNSSTVTITRALPARIASGTYTAKVGVWSSNWGTNYLWNGNAGTLVVSTTGAAALSVAASTTVSGATLQAALVPSRPLTGQYLADVELWSGGNRVYQSFSPVSLSATPVVTLTRTLPPSLPRGNYTARVGLFSSDWATRYSYGDAGTVAAGGATGPSTGAGSVQVSRSAATLTAGFTAASPFPADAVYDIEIWDRNGVRVAQFLDRHAGAGDTRASSTATIPAALGNGTYTVRAGVLGSDLKTAVLWNEAAGSFTVTSPAAVAPDRSAPLGSPGSWHLAFGDEFNGDGLDTTRWSTCSRQMFVARNQCFGHNEELQTYGPGGLSMTSSDDVRGLRLTARSDGSTWSFGHDSVTAGAPLWTSGMISTSPPVAGIDPAAGYTPFSFTYGFFEVRMKVPAGQGLWPAAWLFPADNAGPAEIDLSEVLGNDPATTYMSVHFPAGQSTEGLTGDDLSRGFHTYGVDWEPDRITWYVDGVVARSTYTAAGIPSKPMYPMINLAVGGSWPGAPDASTPSPASTVVDWVRVWQH